MDKEKTITRYVSSKAPIRLWVEGIGEQSNPAVILIAGAGAHAHFLTDAFCQEIIRAGYFVLRFDHRDTGYSSAVDYAKNPYTVFDLVDDVLAILDAFGIARAHVVGHSMGGNIAQLLACRHPERLISFASLSCATVGSQASPPEDVMKPLLENKPTQNFETSLEGFMRSWKILNGDMPLDREMATAYTKELYTRSFHPVGVAWNHIHAQANIPDRTEELGKMTVPGLFLHGEKDMLASPVGGKLTARATKNGGFELIPKMGHMFFDRALESLIAKRLVQHFSQNK